MCSIINFVLFDQTLCIPGSKHTWQWRQKLVMTGQQMSFDFKMT